MGWFQVAQAKFQMELSAAGDAIKLGMWGAEDKVGFECEIRGEFNKELWCDLFRGAIIGRVVLAVPNKSSMDTRASLDIFVTDFVVRFMTMGFPPKSISGL